MSPSARIAQPLDSASLHARYFAQTRDGMLISDPTGRIVDVNPAFTDLTGYTREEAIGRSANLLKSGLQDERFYVEMWQSLIEYGHWQGEIWNRRKSGDLYAERLSISALYDDSGRVSHYVAVFSDITTEKESLRKLETLAFLDPLTHLPNRTLLADRLQQGIALAKRHGEMLAVCYLDLDGFKPINDRHGHGMGDNLLIELACRMLQTVRSNDTVARVGGDEFVLLFPELKSREKFYQMRDRLLAVLDEPYRLGDHTLHVRASLGHALYPDDGDNADALLEQADLAMYAAKQCRSPLRVPSPSRDAPHPLVLPRELRYAI